MKASKSRKKKLKKRSKRSNKVWSDAAEAKTNSPDDEPPTEARTTPAAGDDDAGVEWVVAAKVNGQRRRDADEEDAEVRRRQLRGRRKGKGHARG